MRKNLSTKQIKKYSRQIVLKNVGIIGQKKILNSSVLVVGAGGLGCPVIDYLSRAGVGLIGIIDYDKVDASNIHRQSIYTYKDIGKYKVEVLKRKLKDINPDVKTKIFKSKITNKNVFFLQIIQQKYISWGSIFEPFFGGPFFKSSGSNKNLLLFFIFIDLQKTLS